MGVLASVLGLAGRCAEISDLLEELRANGHATGVALAAVHIGLQEFEQAIDAMEKAYDNRDGSLINMLLEPVVDPLRASPRFQNVVRRMRLPERSWVPTTPGFSNSSTTAGERA